MGAFDCDVAFAGFGLPRSKGRKHSIGYIENGRGKSGVENTYADTCTTVVAIASVASTARIRIRMVGRLCCSGRIWASVQRIEVLKVRRMKL